MTLDVINTNCMKSMFFVHIYIYKTALLKMFKDFHIIITIVISKASKTFLLMTKCIYF